jgi:TDG/mug DNA glycosylase family protein
MTTPPRKPTPEELRSAYGRALPDVIAPALRVLFCGINPGLYTAAVQHHFARPGNRFWPALHDGGFTRRRLYPHEEHELLADGYGVTNIVPFATARADELTEEQLREGARLLEKKMRCYRPAYLAVLGVSAYRAAFDRRKANLGLQPDRIGATRIWVLPSPSGLNAHHQPKVLGAMLRELYEAVEETCGASRDPR